MEKQDLGSSGYAVAPGAVNPGVKQETTDPTPNQTPKEGVRTDGVSASSDDEDDTHSPTVYNSEGNP